MGNEGNLGRIAGMANDIVLKEKTAKDSEKRVGKGREGYSIKVLYWEAPHRGSTPYPSVHHLDRKSAPFIYLLKNTASLF